jgi:hypothetical protein
MSGTTPSSSQAKVLPVRPRPDWISSATKSTFLLVHMARTAFRYPGGGTCTPDSPWIGSIRAATVLSSMAASSAAASPNGTIRNPGVNGPNPSRATGSVEKLTIVVVRPWKLPSITMMLAWSCATPLTSYPHLRDTLIAVSTASAPVFIGRTTSIPASAARSRQKGPSWSL